MHDYKFGEQRFTTQKWPLFSDEVFMPRSESDLENGEIDDFERELEEFKR